MLPDLWFGYAMALGCALGWSISIVMFKAVGDTLHPVVLNLAKNILGLVLFIPTLWFAEGTLSFAIPAKDFWILSISGFLGIGLADFLILKSLSHLGASRLAIVECLYSPFVIMFSLIFLGEALTLEKIAGAGLIIAAVISVTASKNVIPGPKEHIAVGTFWGAIGLFVMAIGIVMMKPMFGTYPLMLVITIRLIAGVVASYGVYYFTPNRTHHLRQLIGTQHKVFVTVACFFSAYLSMVMWVAGFKYNDAMVAAVLNQTSTIFTVLLAVLFLKERLTPAKVLGTVLAMAGVLVMAR